MTFPLLPSFLSPTRISVAYFFLSEWLPWIDCSRVRWRRASRRCLARHKWLNPDCNCCRRFRWLGCSSWRSLGWLCVASLQYWGCWGKCRDPEGLKSETIMSNLKKSFVFNLRVTAPNWIFALVKTPPRQYLVWANSPHSIAAFSTLWAFKALRQKNTTIPPWKAMWAVTLRALRRCSAVWSRSKIIWPNLDPKMYGFILSSSEPSLWP